MKAINAIPQRQLGERIKRIVTGPITSTGVCERLGESPQRACAIAAYLTWMCRQGKIACIGNGWQAKCAGIAVTGGTGKSPRPRADCNIYAPLGTPKLPVAPYGRAEEPSRCQQRLRERDERRANEIAGGEFRWPARRTIPQYRFGWTGYE